MFKKFFIFLLCIIITLSCVGCGSKNSLVGTWKTVDDSYDITMSFYDDGTCLDVPYKTLSSADVKSYKLQDDGVLMLTMEWDGPIIVKSTDNEDTALDDSDYYYLSGDKLIMKGRVFEKQ